MRHLSSVLVAFLLASVASAACSSAKEAAPSAKKDKDDSDDVKSSKKSGKTNGSPTEDPNATCSAPKEMCDGKCMDMSADPKNCGGCGFACGEDETCSKSSCRGANGEVTCAPDLELCGADCFDTTINNAHCGGCENACTLGKTTCTNSKCVVVCSAVGSVRCGDVCCAADETCSAEEQCVPPPPVDDCPVNQKSCSGTCVDTRFSREHCGDCDQPCGDGKTCDQGTCITIGAF